MTNIKWQFKDGKATATYQVNQRIDEGMDSAATKTAKLFGLKWYAQGYNFITGIRDVCFD